VSWRKKDEYIEYVEGKTYTKAELDRIATQMLREDANRIPEHTCESPESGECKCKRRGVGGDNPILFDSHMYARKRREIMVNSGTPDPSIVQGSYNRTHPQGRKVNDPEARKSQGLSFYK